MKKKCNFEKINRGEIPQYLDRMNNGDMEARNKLICHYSNNITNFIENNIDSKVCSKEDLIQSSIIALIEVLEGFKSNDVSVLNSKISYHINYELNKQIDSNNNTLIVENDPYIEEYEDLENINVILDAIKKLPSKKQNIMYLYFYKGYPENAIANMSGITHQYVHQVISESIQFIKQQVFFDSIDFQGNYNILNAINKHLNSDNINTANDNEKINLFFKYIKDLSKKEKKILCIYLYNKFSIDEIANMFNTTENEIEKIINDFILYLNIRINISFDNTEENSKKYNYILSILCSNFKEYNPEEIKTVLLQLMESDNAILERFTNTTSIKAKCRLLSLIVLKTKAILKDNNKQDLNNIPKKK